MAKNKFLKKVIIIDTSVLIKPFLNEPGSEKVLELFKLAAEKKLSLLSPKLMVFEFLNVLCKNIKDPAKVKAAYQDFEDTEIGILDIDIDNLHEAIEISCSDKQISFYDASYHALAKQFNGIFLTADKKYFDLMKKKGNIELLKV